MFDKIRKLNNERIIRKVMNQLDEIISDEKIDEYLKTHPGLTMDYFKNQIQDEKLSFDDFTKMTREEKRKFLVLWYSVEYYERKHNKKNDTPEETKNRITIYRYFIERKFQEQDPI